MVELLQLTEAVLVATAVTISVVAAPVSLMSGEPMPDMAPLLEVIAEDEQVVSD